MSKKIKTLIFITISSIFGLFLVLFIFLNQIVGVFKEELESLGSEILNTTLRFGELKVQVLPTPQIKLTDIDIKSNGLNVQNLSEIDLEFEVIPLIFERKLIINNLTLVRPKITLEKDESGKIYFPGLGLNIKKSVESQENEGRVIRTKPEIAPTQSSSKSDIVLAVKQFKIKAGQVKINFDTPAKVSSLDEINLSLNLNQDSNTKDFEIQDFNSDFEIAKLGKLEILAKSINLVNSNQNLEIPEVQVKLVDQVLNLKARYDLTLGSLEAAILPTQLDISKTLGLLKTLELVKQDYELSGETRLDAPKIIWRDNLLNLAGQIEIKGLAASIPNYQIKNGDLKFDIKTDTQNGINIVSDSGVLNLNGEKLQIDSEVTLKRDLLDVNKLIVKGFGGDSAVKLQLFFDAEKSFAGTLDLNNLVLSRILQIQAIDSAQLTGKLEQVSANFTGNLVPNVMANLKINGKVKVTEGAIKKFNLAAETLKNIKNLPFISGALFNKVPENYRKVLDEADTKISLLTTKFTYAQNNLALRDLYLQSSIYSTKGQGQIKVPSSVDFENQLVFNKEFTQALVHSASELKNILNSEDLLELPLKISGDLPVPNVYPDIDRLLKLAARRGLTKKAGELLGDALGIGKEQGKSAIEGIRSLFD